MGEPLVSPLVSGAWLAERLGGSDLQVVDATWHMPAENRNGRADYEAAHIPGAVFFDIDAISDHATDLPHMLPSPQAFAETVGMNPRHLSALKSSEARHHYFNELGTTKLACLWMLEHLGESRK